MRQEHLERLGWTFHRIWSQDWFKDKQSEIEKAKRAYEEAVKLADRFDATDSEERRREQSSNSGDQRPSVAVPDDRLNNRGACPIRLGRPSIDDYTDAELVQLIRWIESDTLLRTEDQLIDEAVRVLGFQRRGKRIVAALERAIGSARRSG